MVALLRNSVVGQAYTSGSGATSLTLTSGTTPKAGDLAIAIISATGNARSEQVPLSVNTTGWTNRFTQQANSGPSTIVLTRRLTVDGAFSINVTNPGIDTGLHGSIAVYAGAGDNITVTPNYTNHARANTTQGTSGSTSQNVTAPSVNLVVGMALLTWHPTYFTSGTPSWGATLPSGRATWQPTTVADAAIAGLATYAAATAAAASGTKTAVLSAARNSSGYSVTVPADTGPNVEHVATTVAGGAVASSSVWCPKPAGAAADDEPSTFRFSGQSTARQRVIIQRFRNCHPTSPILTAPVNGANTATASTSHVAPDVAWSPRSMLAVIWSTYNGPGVWNAITPNTMTVGRAVPENNTTAQEMHSASELSAGTTLNSGTRTATYNVSSVWNAQSLVIRAADTVATGMEILVAWHTMDASQGSGTMDTFAWGGWNLLNTFGRVSSAGASNTRIYWQFVPAYLSDPIWTADTDVLSGSNDSPNPSCQNDAAGYAVYNTSESSGGRVTDLTFMEKPTGFRATRTASTRGNLGIYSTAQPCTPGEVISWSADVEVNQFSDQLNLYAAFLNSSGSPVSFSGLPFAPLAVPFRPARYTGNATVPANITQFSILAWVPNAPPNSFVEYSALRTRRGAFTYLPYLDGDSYRCMWNGLRGASTSQRNTSRFPEMATSALGTDMGYFQTQREISSGNFVSSPAALPVQDAVFGRPGRMIRADMPPPSYQRVEHNPEHRQFVSGEEYFFSFAFALPAGWPTWVNDFWVIEQLHAAPDQGSPVISFECRDYSLRMRGGDGKPNTTGGNFGTTYGYNLPLLQNLRVNRWYSVVYRVLFSDQNGGGSVDVWVDNDRKVTNFAVPGGTVYAGGPTYRKQGAYKRPAIEAEEVYHAGSALGRSYVAVDPMRPQTIVASDSAPAEFF